MAFTLETNFAVQIVFISAATIAVAFRHVSAYLMSRGRGSRSIFSILTDLAITASWGFLMVCAGISIWRWKAQTEAYKTKGALFVSAISLPLTEIPTALKGILAESFTYITSLWMIKAALLAMMYDVRQYLDRKLLMWLHFTTAFTFACWAALNLVGFTICLPFERNWSLGSDHCTPVTMKVVTVVTVLSIMSDIFIFAIPVVLVRSLRLHSSIIVAIGFTVAFFVSGAVLAILRVLAMRDLTLSVNVFGKVEFFSGIQLTLNLVIACIPQFRILLRKRAREESQTSIVDQRREILGFLPKEVGNLVIMKTVEVQVQFTDQAGMGVGSMTQLKRMQSIVQDEW